MKRHLRQSSLRDQDGPLSLETPPEYDVEWIQNWAVDVIRVVGKFGSGLVSDPQSVYRQLPSFCPKKSIIGTIYASTKQDTLTVSGLTAGTWDDCLASVSVGKDDYISQVLTTEMHFVTLVSSTGVMVVWSAETCEQLRVIRCSGYVLTMALNKAGSEVASVGIDNYTVWELSTGESIHRCTKSSDGLVLDLRFEAVDSELVVGLKNNRVYRVNLISGEISETRIQLPADADFSYHGSPWRMALSPDLTKLAAAWRGRPPLIWDIQTGATHPPRKCIVSTPSDSICAPELLRWHPDNERLMVLCQDTKMVEWQIFEGEQREFSHVNAREMVVSDDGNFLLSSDHTGAISIRTLPRLNLVYKLVNEDDPSANLAFSPRCERFYDVRGSTCNVWEPDALVRADEHDLEDRSCSGDTTVLTEPTISHFNMAGKMVTAIALDAGDKYYCCGREDGRVTTHDAVDGTRLRKVYSHWTSSTVVNISWSISGKYIVSCEDGAFVIAKRLQAKGEGTWAVFPVFDSRLDEPINQFFFSAGEQYLLISTPSTDHVWDFATKARVKVHKFSARHSRRWIQHPLRTDMLVWIGPTSVQCCAWPTLESVDTAAQAGPSIRNTGVLDLEIPRPKRSREPSMDRSRYVSWASTTTDNGTVVCATLPGEASLMASCLSHSGLHIEFEDAASLSRGSRQDASKHCVPSVAEKIRLLLGIYKSSLVFLDHECWLCTWNVHDEIGTITRHFFVPKDCLNTSTSHMASINSHGTLFCPRYGDVAIVRNGIRM